MCGVFVYMEVVVIIFLMDASNSVQEELTSEVIFPKYLLINVGLLSTCFSLQPPKPKPETKWEKYAKLKGIQKKKKGRKVWDEELKVTSSYFWRHFRNNQKLLGGHIAFIMC